MIPPGCGIQLAFLAAVGSVTPNERHGSEGHTRPHSLNVGMCAGYGFGSCKARIHGLISVRDIDASKVVIGSRTDERIERVLNAATHGPATVALAGRRIRVSGCLQRT